eukprot:9469086-Pyramimonas_sp.AAC.1
MEQGTEYENEAVREEEEEKEEQRTTQQKDEQDEQQENASGNCIICSESVQVVGVPYRILPRLRVMVKAGIVADVEKFSSSEELYRYYKECKLDSTTS